MAGRRNLAFARIDDVMPDVDQLLTGYTTVGRWTLAQICHHLEGVIRYSMDGFPGRRAPWMVRKTVGAIVLRRTLGTGRIPEGVKVPEVFLLTTGLDDRAEAETLRATVARFVAFPGPFRVHPFVDTLTPDQWARFHCIHCAHHLSFALPDGIGVKGDSVP